MGGRPGIGCTPGKPWTADWKLATLAAWSDNGVIRALLVLPLLPFVRYAAADLAFHYRTRKPRVAESLVHVLLGLFQAALVVHAFRLDLPRVAVAILGIAVFGAIDELVFHRGLPAEESDLHAKSHIALFAFAAAAVALCVLPEHLR